MGAALFPLFYCPARKKMQFRGLSESLFGGDVRES